ncbi:LysR family transcriptional regulator [Sediminibacterium ginsengisoli]|uniref:DNA-binding transcriptional regulator, LysR family n=1 Tax=Sediminibacterium ginsengisoli TaxID=413434 RepID=A0A1T4LI36_9BACT|nr:LysR family transcriptional regulator [Sediminibacterium ginsengisoli]SJZ54469.1 DNA-binding transcriptional regulator, LysR family [Sediminibacterium ginsengisoli]
MISVRHEVFIEVAQQKSFSKASQSLYISQPAVSRHIKALEAEYGIQLFERKGVHVELTAAGRLLHSRLADVKRIQEETAFELSSMKDVMQAKGILKLGGSTTVALYILPRVLSVFNQVYPQINISLLNRNTEIVVDALLNEEINLGITEGRTKLSNIQYQPFVSDRVVAVCSRKSPFARKKNYAVQDITGMPVALRERGSGTLAALRHGLEKNGIRISDLNVKVRLGGTEALKNFLVESESVGFLPQKSVMRELEQGDLAELSFEGLHIQRNFYFIQRKGENSELNNIFIKLAKQTYNL